MRADEPSTTAEAVCYMRATDQRREPKDRILDDPYAKLFLGPVFRGTLATLEVTGRLGERAEQLLPGITTYVLARHRFIDDKIRASLDAGEMEQLVLLGAGYDTRAYRFADLLDGRPVFEVDHPSTSRRKAEVIAEHASELPNPNVKRVEIDFQTQSLAERLAAAGFKTGRPTFFSWEGVSMYLRRDAVKATLRTLRELAAPGSGVAMDFWYLLDAPDFIATAHRMSANLLHFLGEPITFGIHPEDVGHFLERLGLEQRDLATAEDLERRYIHDERKVYAANYVLHARTTA